MYILEGNIGAGKSTFLNLAAKHSPHLSVSLEPLHNWQKQVYGQSLLANFIENPQRWAYTMETLTMMCRVKEHLQEQSHPIERRIMERSIYSGHYCFALNGYENGFMNQSEWDMYNQWYQFMVPGKCMPPKGFIYLQVNPEIAHERIKKRNRLAEKKITLAYLKHIHAKHNDFLLEKKNIPVDLAAVPVLVLDANLEFENDQKVLNEYLFKVDEFMHMTYKQTSQVTLKQKHV